MYYHVRKKDSFPSDKITFDTLSFERRTSKCLYGNKNLTFGEGFKEGATLMTCETRCDFSTRDFGQLLKQHF